MFRILWNWCLCDNFNSFNRQLTGWLHQDYLSPFFHVILKLRKLGGDTDSFYRRMFINSLCNIACKQRTFYAFVFISFKYHCYWDHYIWVNVNFLKRNFLKRTCLQPWTDYFEIYDTPFCLSFLEIGVTDTLTFMKMRCHLP